jgi:hypothetical protein
MVSWVCYVLCCKMGCNSSSLLNKACSLWCNGCVGINDLNYVWYCTVYMNVDLHSHCSSIHVHVLLDLLIY